MKRTIAFTVLLFTALSLPLLAQQPMGPGPEHQMLKKLEGTWIGKVKAGDEETTGTMISKMELGGLWLVTTYEGNFGGMKFEGRGLDSYDPVKKKYVSVWVDSMSSFPLISEGTYDKEKKTLTMKGQGMGPDGKPATYKIVTVHPEEDRQIMTIYLITPGGDETKLMATEYTRKK